MHEAPFDHQHCQTGRWSSCCVKDKCQGGPEFNFISGADRRSVAVMKSWAKADNLIASPTCGCLICRGRQKTFAVRFWCMLRPLRSFKTSLIVFLILATLDINSTLSTLACNAFYVMVGLESCEVEDVVLDNYTENRFWEKHDVVDLPKLKREMHREFKCCFDVIYSTTNIRIFQNILSTEMKAIFKRSTKLLLCA